MTTIKLNKDQYLLRIESSEELFSSLLKFAAKEAIKSGFFYGIGACKTCLMGRYNKKIKIMTGRKLIVKLKLGV